MPDNADTPLSPEELVALEELCEKATPGPWEPMYDDCDQQTYIDHDGECIAFTNGVGPADADDANGKLMAAARTALPRLLRELRRLRENESAESRVEALQKALQEVRTWGIGRFEQIEQSLRSLPDVPPLADIVRTWRDTMELAALAPDAEFGLQTEKESKA